MRKKANAVQHNLQRRILKDYLKQELKNNHPLNLNFRGVIVPKIVHEPSVVDYAMQWYFNGFVLSFGDGALIVDPGVGFYSRFTTTGLTIKDIRGIFISHEHLDHCGDLLVFIDMIAKTETPVDMFLPINLIENVLPPYYRDLVYDHPSINLIVMYDDKSAGSNRQVRWSTLDSLELLQLHHSTEHTFGFRMVHADEKIAYISDTGYATELRSQEGLVSPRETTGAFESIAHKHEELKGYVKDIDTLLCNINDLAYNRHSLTHLSGWDVSDMLEGSTVKRLILLHLSPYDAEGKNSTVAYTDFFEADSITCLIPDSAGLEVEFL